MKPRLLIMLIAPFLLTGCLLSPGKFTSELAVMKDGSFSYSYNGEIQMLALSKLAEMGSKTEEQFEAKDCYEDNGYDMRECTESEIDAQKAEWDADAESRRMKNDEEAAKMKMMLGGIDPSNPEAAEEFAAQLSRQKGWNSVIHRGDGLFIVDFSISGKLTHDFTFPTVEKLPIGSSFVSVILRKDGKLRVDAPGFAAQGAGNPMQGMMGGILGMANAEKGEGDKMPNLVMPEGTFTIVTAGQILANNTDEGPALHARGQVLNWRITPRSEHAPTALIDLSS